ncbi:MULTISPECIES: hypothetical protein [unclassified Nocardia]|nr:MULTISPECIES: hypothetical protein [unclassified Nocardia]
MNAATMIDMARAAEIEAASTKGVPTDAEFLRVAAAFEPHLPPAGSMR